ncbi:MAG: hypothetical protein ABI658_12235 [Acidimicrobiales bacterium]
MVALFVIGLVAAKAWLPGPLHVTESCREAFEQPAIATDENAMVAAVAACGSWAEFTKAARDKLDMDATEFEEFRCNACRAGSAANLVRPCLPVE